MQTQLFLTMLIERGLIVSFFLKEKGQADKKEMHEASEEKIFYS
jgi:hypothetical protein